MEQTARNPLSSYRSAEVPLSGASQARAACIIALVVGACLLGGCSRPAIRASQLPSELQANVRHHSGTIDLSRFSSPGVSDSLIGPRDLLKVTVASGRTDETTVPILVRVGNDGTATIPLIGPVHVAGKEAYEASQSIVEAGVDGGIYVKPYVTVEIESKAKRSVTVLGAVNEPGVHELPYENSSLVSALAAAGGLTEEAGNEVQIIRQPTIGFADNEVHPDPARQQPDSDVELASYHSQDGPMFSGPAQHQEDPRMHQSEIINLDLTEGITTGAVDTRLGDRDIVKVSTRSKEFVFVTGLVTQPGQFEMPLDQDIHLLDGIAMAGGLSSPVADKVLIVRRRDDQSEPTVIEASLNKAKKNGAENIRLAAGDTISVEQTSATVIVDTFNKLFRVTFGLAGRTSVF